jgi:hypothetical protein
MTSLEPQAKRCLDCGSHHVGDSVVRLDGKVKIVRTCSMCKTIKTIWEGTSPQYRVYLRAKHANEKKLKRRR